MDFTGRVVCFRGSWVFVLLLCVCERNNILATSYSVAGDLQSITEAYSMLISNIFLKVVLPDVVYKFSLIVDFLCSCQPEKELSMHDI